MAPLGSLLTGVLAAWLGLAITLLINGLVCLAGAAFFALSLPRLRVLVQPIYARLNLLPPLTTGIGSASELETAMKE